MWKGRGPHPTTGAKPMQEVTITNAEVDALLALARTHLAEARRNDMSGRALAAAVLEVITDANVRCLRRSVIG